jgi:hypothetical protein
MTSDSKNYKSRNVYFDPEVLSYIEESAEKNCRSFSQEINFTFKSILRMKPAITWGKKKQDKPIWDRAIDLMKDVPEEVLKEMPKDPLQ